MQAADLLLWTLGSSQTCTAFAKLSPLSLHLSEHGDALPGCRDAQDAIAVCGIFSIGCPTTYSPAVVFQGADAFANLIKVHLHDATYMYIISPLS
jgi:hypothetical protein